MKENAGFQVMELSGESSIVHDDKFLLRAVKSTLGLAVDYRQYVDIKHRGTGERVIVNYILPGDEVKSITVEQYGELTEIERREYRPQFLRGLELGDGVSLEIKNNQVDMRLYNLFDNLGSRYRTALDNLIELEARGVLQYKPRTPETDRNRTEAIRQRLKRKMKPAEYEHDILISGELGRLMYRDLSKVETARVAGEAGTIYLSGFKKYKKQETAYKFYDVGARDGQEGGEYFKIEITLYKEYFKRNGLQVNDITTQVVTQEKILDRLTGIYGKIISKLQGDTVELLQEKLNFYPKGRERDIHRALATELLKPERTLTERVAELERRMQRVERKVFGEEESKP